MEVVGVVLFVGSLKLMPSGAQEIGPVIELRPSRPPRSRLLLGFFYVLYHREPMRHLRMRLLALIVTAAVYLPAFPVGYGALESGLFEGLGDATNGLTRCSMAGRWNGCRRRRKTCSRHGRSSWPASF